MPSANPGAARKHLREALQMLQTRLETIVPDEFLGDASYEDEVAVLSSVRNQVVAALGCIEDGNV